ncbi:glycosyltransferase family protein [Brevibacillus migulae]|uniref:glycosyltransferase n=1 Tax=Brevibacillus migulae TaxID=1644114 RepID=UPI00196ADA84|nr:glycosyltransferase [Brevibacillus migulae]
MSGLDNGSEQSWAKEFWQLIQAKQEVEAAALLNKLGPAGFTIPSYYIGRAALSICDRNPNNAWLWLWRGLESFPQHPALVTCMKLLQLMGGHETERYTESLSLENEENTITIRNWKSVLQHLPGEQNMQKPNVRVLQGTMEIANQMHTLAKGLELAGAYAKTLSYYDFYLRYPVDYHWVLKEEPGSQTIHEKLRHLATVFQHQYDVFHFHFGTSLTQDQTDLPLLKEAGKVMVMHHWGSDVRRLSVLKQTNPYAVAKSSNEGSIHQRLKRLSAHIRHCFVADKELYLYVKDYYEHVYFIPQMIDLTLYPLIPQPAKKAKPLIVHAPTSPYVKGTEHILKAVQSLQGTYDFDFKLIQRMSHEEAKMWYSQADLIIDQLCLGSHGLFAIESMALGKPVICWISDYMKEHYPAELPLIAANPDTIQSTLAHLLQNQELLPEIGKQGRMYVERYHDMKTNSQTVLDIYQQIMANQ